MKTIKIFLDKYGEFFTDTDDIQFQLGDEYINPNWMIHFHDSLNMPQSNDFNKYEITGKTYTWKLSSFRLLKSPYQTDCKDYRQSTEYLSRKDCIRKCKIRVSVGECEVVFKAIDIQRGEPPVHFGNSSKQSEQACFNNLNFTEICTKSCPNYDCSINYYEPVVLHKAKRPKNKPDTILQIMIPYESETSYYYQPRIEIVEFVCYLFSTFNMWYGFFNVFPVFNVYSFFQPS